ncbi:hypothetical protein AC1031_021359 [Aphanomyces cochlioides]|nr:hypothetical protein AC1031_021359 [Aphanomyces cochlioides]
MPGDLESFGFDIAEERANERSRSRDCEGIETEAYDRSWDRPKRRQVPKSFRSPRRRQPPPIDDFIAGWQGAAYANPPAEETSAHRPATDTASSPLPHVDVDMVSDNGMEFGNVNNAPAIPQPPTFRGSTKAKRRVFVREYQKYLNQINTANHGLSTLCHAALFDLSQDHNEVTESEWQAWFMEAFEEDPLDLDIIHRRLQGVIRFDTKSISTGH